MSNATEKLYEGDRFIVIEQVRPRHFLTVMHNLPPREYRMSSHPLRWEVIDRDIFNNEEMSVRGRFLEAEQARWLCNMLNAAESHWECCMKG